MVDSHGPTGGKICDTYFSAVVFQEANAFLNCFSQKLLMLHCEIESSFLLYDLKVFVRLKKYSGYLTMCVLKNKLLP